MNLEGHLYAVFHKESFRPGQKEVIQAILNGKDVLAIWPTGAGKSLVYQFPALLLPNLTIVVSPLVALMQDQVRNLQRLGIKKSCCMTSADSSKDIKANMVRIKKGEIKILFISPERLNSPGFLEQFAKIPVSLIAVDEAHCISQWGHDFRPDYLYLGQAVCALKPRSVMALTATAGDTVKKQIMTLLGMRSPEIFIHSLDRDNLHFSAKNVGKASRKELILQQLLRRWGMPAIVYVNRRSEAETLSSYLQSKGIDCGYYHAGLSNKDRTLAQILFVNGDIPVIAATIAFGMGIDKPDVRQVIHASPPLSLEGYYQEAGRAGRDGQSSRCLMLYSNTDFQYYQTLLQDKYPPYTTFQSLYNALGQYTPAQLRCHFLQLSCTSWRLALTTLLGMHYQVGTQTNPRVSFESSWRYLESLRLADYRRLEEVRRYANTSFCRRNALLSYFDEESSLYCSGCDNCGCTVSQNEKENYKEKSGVFRAFSNLWQKVAVGADSTQLAGT